MCTEKEGAKADRLGSLSCRDPRLLGLLLGSAEHVQCIAPEADEHREQQKGRRDPRSRREVHSS
jgi:hypothetical protein